MLKNHDLFLLKNYNNLVRLPATGQKWSIYLLRYNKLVNACINR